MNWILFCLAAFATAQMKPPLGGKMKPFDPPASETFTLGNGMRVALVPYGSVPRVSIQAVLRAGTFAQPLDQQGIADLTAEMMKQGTTRFPAEQLSTHISRLGGALTVQVRIETMSVGGSVLSEHGAEFLAVLAEILRRPLLPAEALPAAISKLQQRMEQERQEPGTKARERIVQLFYGRGTPSNEQVSGYRLDDVRRYYARSVHPSQAHLYVVGRFEASAVREAVKLHFEPWKTEGVSMPVAMTPNVERRTEVIHRPGASQSAIRIAVPAPDPSHPDYIAFLVADALLADVSASRLSANLRERHGYTYGAWSTMYVPFRSSLWILNADVATGVTKAALREIHSEIDRLRNEPPALEECRGVQNYVAGRYVIRLSSAWGLVNQIALLDMQQMPAEFLSRFVPAVLAVTPADIHRVARMWFDPAKMTTIIVGDKGQIGELPPE
ncbi:MAG: insulinase family protein [Acidobacteria bacterium]|nr:insulinase family protein [Acidobacteriota bacterium]